MKSDTLSPGTAQKIAVTGHVTAADPLPADRWHIPADTTPPSGAAWRLPADSTIAAAARTRIADELAALELADDLIETATLMASELAANAHQHAMTGPMRHRGPAELWLYSRQSRDARTELVIAVFDPAPDQPPRLRDLNVLAESGRGLALIDHMTQGCWGHYRTRSWLSRPTVPGKAVWFTLPLP